MAINQNRVALPSVAESLRIPVRRRYLRTFPKRPGLLAAHGGTRSIPRRVRGMRRLLAYRYPRDRIILLSIRFAKACQVSVCIFQFLSHVMQPAFSVIPSAALPPGDVSCCVKFWLNALGQPANSDAQKV